MSNILVSKNNKFKLVKLLQKANILNICLSFLVSKNDKFISFNLKKLS